jgi:hypothetical protein
MAAKTPFLFMILLFFGTVICFDIIGALLMAIRYAFWLSNDSLYFLAYPLWAVVAIFNGYYFSSVAVEKIPSDFPKKQKQLSIGFAVFLTSIFLLFSFSYLGQMEVGGTDNYWVPGNLSLTITYFSVLNIAVVLHLSGIKK